MLHVQLSGDMCDTYVTISTKVLLSPSALNISPVSCREVRGIRLSGKKQKSTWFSFTQGLMEKSHCHGREKDGRILLE